MPYQNPWTYNNIPVTELPINTIGFVYIITCTNTNKKYIGKKLHHFTKTKIKTITLKNGQKKKKKIKELVESDWKSYYGSSEALQHDVDTLGFQNFKREILHLCTSKAICSYLELREQIIRDVLLYPDMYYNGIVQAKIHRNHVKDLIIK